MTGRKTENHGKSTTEREGANRRKMEMVEREREWQKEEDRIAER